MFTPLALVLEQPAAMHGQPGMILQSSLFLVIVERLQCAKQSLSTSVHARTYQLTTRQKTEVCCFYKKTCPQKFEKNTKQSVVCNLSPAIK